MKNDRTPNRNNMARTSDAMRLRVAVLVTFFIIAGFGILLYQLYALQLRDVEKYRTEAVEQQLKDVTLPATRGSIYSATGKLLAKSTTVWNIIADPYISSNVDVSYLRQASDTIAGLLNDEDITSDDIYECLTDSGRRYKVLARNVEKPVADAIMEFADSFRLPDEDGNAGQGKYILSLWTEQSSVRSYPYGAFLSSVLGFCDADGNGFYGLEKSYNDLLAGTPGRSVAPTNVNGVVLNTDEAKVHEAIDGYNLNLTIDENVQGIVEEYLYKAVQDFSVKNRGCAIVMNVKTGAIYAMASVEQFDPNDPYKIYDETLLSILDGGVLDATTSEILQQRLGEDATADIVADGQISEEEYTQVQGMMREAQWKNKTISELYYPGSVFKLVTASAGLDSGLMEPGQTFYCSGAFTVNENSEKDMHTYHCALNEAHGMLDMAGALNHSCNLYFIQASQVLSPTVFYDYIQAFGFTQATGVDLPGESRWTIIHDADAMAQINTNLYSQAFGQNLAITPLQMVTAVAAIANGGYLVTPYVVDTVTDAGGNVVQKTETTIRRQVISEEVSRTLLAMMENNVDPTDGGYHSCKNAYVAGYRIGAKSGTSEELDRSVRPTDGDYRKAMSLAAVLPVDDPEIVVYVMLDDPRHWRDYASEVVAPIVGNIISEIAPYLGIAQDAGYNPSGEVQITNCVGKSWTDAQVALNLQGLGHKIIGTSNPTDTILYQYPYGGTDAPAGSTVYLYTNSTVDQTTTVPDVTGKTGSFASQMLQAAGLNAQIEGSASDRVVAQAIEAESTVPMGTIVTLTTQAGSEAEQTPESEPEQTPEADPDRDAAAADPEE